jgi:hypothetical protein
MRKHSEFATPFWRAASKSLPRKYRSQLKSAESFELMLNAAAELWKSAADVLHHTPRRSAH